MIKKLVLGAVLIASASSLYPVDASTQTESTKKSKPLINMQDVKKVCHRGVKAAGNSARFFYVRRNTKPARIGWHALKIVGGIWAIVGSFKTMESLQDNHKHAVEMFESYIGNAANDANNASARNADTQSLQAAQSYGASILSPRRLIIQSDQDNYTCTLIPIARPPYEAILPIAAYLIYDGCRGIYRELKNPWIGKNDATQN